MKTEVLIGFVLASLATLSEVACKTTDKTSCSVVAAHVAQLVRSEVAKDGDPKRMKEARANVPALQDAILIACERQDWKAKTRECIASAKTAGETTQCQPIPQDPAPQSPQQGVTKPLSGPKTQPAEPLEPGPQGPQN